MIGEIVSALIRGTFDVLKNLKEMKKKPLSSQEIKERILFLEKELDDMKKREWEIVRTGKDPLQK